LLKAQFERQQLSMAHEDTLSKVDLFTGLDKKHLRSLAASTVERSYPAGSVLMKQGDTGAGLFMLVSGKVKITQETGSDTAEEDLGTMGAGAVLGEMALLDDLPRSATVTALEDVKALLLPIWDFRTALQNNPEIGVKLLATLSHRLRKAEGKSQGHN
jgi:CRP/FNR family transcriptional regulator